MPTSLVILCIVYALSAAGLCVLIAGVAIWDFAKRVAAKRADRRRWMEIDHQATAFRAELDSVDWAEEMSHYGGRAA
jgi:hypothetical protein